MDIPCTPDCPDRSAVCHGTCPRYAAFWDECEKQREARRINKETHDLRAGAWKYLKIKYAKRRQGRR